MTNLDQEFSLEELISQVVFWQKRVKALAPSFYARGENAAAFNEAAENLNVWIVRLLTNHFELFVGSLKMDPKGTQNPWVENSPAIIRLKQGVINTQIPVRHLQLFADLYEKVNRKMTTKVFKTNIESVFINGATVEWALINGNIMSFFRKDNLVWEPIDVLPKSATAVSESLRWMIRKSIVDFVRRQVGGHEAQNPKGVLFNEGGLDKYNVVIDDVIYRIRFYKAGVGFMQPTLVVVLEETPYLESDTLDERRKKLWRNS
jgi:hypothetical protein